MAKDKKKTSAKSRRRAKQIIRGMSRDELASFVQGMADEQDAITNRLIACHADEVDDDDLQRMEDEIDLLFHQYSFGTTSFAGKLYAPEQERFDESFRNLLKNRAIALSDHHQPETAMDAAAHLLDHLLGAAFCRDREREKLTQECRDALRSIVSACPPEKQEDLRREVDFLLESLSDEETLGILQTLRDNELASTRDIREQLEELDEIIRSCEGQSECAEVELPDGSCRPAVLLRIDLMRRKGVPEERIEKYRNAHRSFRAIRLQYIGEAKKAKDDDRLRAVLLESKKLDADNPWEVHDYNLSLGELYHRSGEREKERDIYLDDYLHCSPADVKIFCKVRDACTRQEWPKYRQKMLAPVTDRYRLCELYAADQMTEELYALVFQNPDLYTLDRFGLYLAKDHSKEILSIYEKQVRREIELASKRSHYRAVGKRLKIMQKYPGGKELAHNLAWEWIDRWPRKSALFDVMEDF